MEQVKWISHKGKDILFGGYNGIKDQDEYKRLIALATELSIKEINKRCKEPINSTLMLVDLRDSVISAETVSAFKENAKRIHPYIKKSAVLGIHGVRKILLESIIWFSGLDAKPFEDMEKAKDWLVEE